MRAGLAVPIADQVAVAPKRQQHGRLGASSEAGRQRQIAARRTSHGDDALRIGLKQLRPLLVHPAEGIFEVFDNQRQLRFRSQPVIDRDQRITGLGCPTANAAIDAQGDTVRFGAFDFQASAASEDVPLGRSYMVLFGGPGPGGKAMADAVTLGLDAFCQKFLIWEDQQGTVHLSFNDLLALAERQDVPKRLPLRVINFRLSSVFGEALAME